MKHHSSLVCISILVWSVITAPGAFPVVSNIAAAQHAGTKLVGIGYDVTADTPTVSVSLEISSDGGTTFSVPKTTVSGAIGERVPVGMGRVITWDAGADWTGQYSSQMRFKVTATDEPIGFSLIPAGDFQMGDALDGDANAPVHTVNVSPFYLQKMGVTKAEWDAVRAWGLIHGYTDLAVGAGKAGDHPVQSVSWYDVVKWSNARSEQEGLTPCFYTNLAKTAVYRTGVNNIDSSMTKWIANGYRLPTEAEREKAARGGLSGKRFPLGDTISHSQANYYSFSSDPYDISPTRGYHPLYGTGGQPSTSPAGSFPANGYGLYDMEGNVRDWCWDAYAPYGLEIQTDPQGGASSSDRVVRGGSWSYGGYACRVSIRNYFYSTGTNFSIGFRSARSSVLPGGFAVTANVVTDTRVKVALTTYTRHGTVTGAGDYTPGSTATLTAAAAPGYVFSNWSGDAGGTVNPLSLVMDNPKSITANFAPDTTDVDGDGLSLFDEVVTYGSNPLLTDTDGDTFLDGAEVEFGGNPLSPATVPEFRARALAGPGEGTFQVRFLSQQGKTYALYASSDLAGWTQIEAGITGTGGTIFRLYSIKDQPNRYFRAARN